MPFTALTTTLTGAIPTVMAAGALRRTAKWARGGKPKAKRAATRRKTTKRKATARKRR